MSGASHLPKDDMGLRFRKRPIEVEAWQWPGTDRLDAAPWWLREYRSRVWDPERKMHMLQRAKPELSYFSVEWLLVIPTLEGNHIASPGDWIIRGVKGEVYPCKPDIFEETYERI